MLTDKMTNLFHLACMLFQPQKSGLLSLRNHAKSLGRNYSVRRCILEVPANNSRKVQFALNLNVDCLNFSLVSEPISEFKDHGRKLITKLLNDENNPENLTEFCVTVHPVQYRKDFLLDLDAILNAKNLPQAITLPHLDNCEQFGWFLEEVTKRIKSRERRDRGPIKLLLEISSPKGIMTLPELCKGVQDMTASTPLELSALIYGYDELRKHLGTVRTPGGLECLYSRQKLVLVAKAFGLQAIDLPHKSKTTEKEFSNECQDGVVLGFTGKMVLSPNQITLTQSIFSPSRQRVKESQYIAQNNESHDPSDDSYKPSTDPDELAAAKYVLEVAEVVNKYKPNIQGSEFVKSTKE